MNLRLLFFHFCQIAPCQSGDGQLISQITGVGGLPQPSLENGFRVVRTIQAEKGAAGPRIAKNIIRSNANAVLTVLFYLIEFAWVPAGTNFCARRPMTSAK